MNFVAGSLALQCEMSEYFCPFCSIILSFIRNAEILKVARLLNAIFYSVTAAIMNASQVNFY